MEKIQITLEPVDNNRLLNLCGPLNTNLKEIELRFDVEINQRGNLFNLIGVKKNISLASNFIKDLYLKTEKDNISITELRNFLQEPNVLKSKMPLNGIKNSKSTCFQFKNYKINIEKPNQLNFYSSILKNDVVFSVGSAGSGKTFLAIGAALHCYELGLIKKIILVRPAVEAGENLGFLPGDLQDKIDPYLKPIYDALEDMIPIQKMKKFIENKTIEIAPLAYMRGRTLKNAFILLDEAQNTTKSQLKMFLTRLGENSKMIVTGDISQIDLKKDQSSGLIDAKNKLQDINGIGFTLLDSSDVLRHKLVKKILDKYKK